MIRIKISDCAVTQFLTKNPHATQSGNREWVTSTESITITGKKLGSWTIFKGAMQQKKWHLKTKALGCEHEGYHICTSQNGWTDNELGIENLKRHFELQLAAIQKGEYRILIVNGHDSHFTTEAIRFCTKHNILSSVFHHIRRIVFSPCMSALWRFRWRVISKAYGRNLSVVRRGLLIR
jgi:hypothetical protein